ncbi:MAG: glycosyl hydrolase 2 galactose-binding domain-containing protein [Rhodanobacteraceae bacterium]
MRMQTRHPYNLIGAALFGCLAIGLPRLVVAATPPPLSNTITAGAVSSTPIDHWEIQSSANAQQGGQAISEPDYSTKGWYPTSGNATVMAGLLENNKYPNIFYGPNLRQVQVPDSAGHDFQIPWWYRTTFQSSGAIDGMQTFIKVNGIIPAADLWLNGKEIANRQTIAGAYTMHTFDVTQLVHAGQNVLAVKVYPASTQRDFSLGWIDWNPAPPDNNMGVWRNIDIVRTGPVSLHGLHVISRLDLPGMQHASLTVKVQVRNNTANAEDALVSGQVAGVTLSRSVHLTAQQTRALTFSPDNNPKLRLDHPKVWWPAGMGSHPLYQATLTASVDNALSDRAHTTFGIRDVSSHLTRQGYRQFAINGHPLLIRGGGWAPDMFLRDQPARLADEFRYISNLGLNAIRSEGKLERPDFYNLADREGILVLAGWECCDKWEAWAKTGGEPWDNADLKIAGESMTSEAKRLRDHPAVIAFLIGSDNAPPPQVAETYVDALRAADWPDPIISAASAQKTQAAGPSGMKMSGPYAWVPPDYWYAEKVGGAFGFNSETSAGIDIPRLSTLRNMLTPRALKALWSNPDVRQFHAAPFWSSFSSLKPFDTALAHRYGAPKNLRDYVEKAQLANYEAVRAQFEAYDAHMNAAQPSTGVIYWMLDNAWPSLHWHLFSHDLNPAGAFFGAKKANEPVHIQYSYDDRSIMAINHTLHTVSSLDARIRVYKLDGSVRYDKRLTDIDLPANHATRLTTIPAMKDVSTTYFVELDLTAADGHDISRNVYWLSNQPDQLGWPDSTWYTTPVSRYANLTALQQLPPTTVDASVRTQRKGEQGMTAVTLTAAPTAKNVALFVHLSIRQSGNDKPVLPVIWDDNDVSLWPGESATLTAHYQVTGQASPEVELSGWNVGSRTLSSATH